MITIMMNKLIINKSWTIFLCIWVNWDLNKSLIQFDVFSEIFSKLEYVLYFVRNASNTL